MPDEKCTTNTDNSRKGTVRKSKSKKEALRVAQIVYGDKNLTDCMESVIRLRMEK